MKNLLTWSDSDMHIHPSSPNSSISEENAATKIQANFRGYRVRKQMKDTPGMNDEHGTRAISTNASDIAVAAKKGVIVVAGEEEKSATKIQAGVRGFLVRKKQKLASDAAVKIQSSFRGFKARQEFKKLKDKWFMLVFRKRACNWKPHVVTQAKG